MKVLVVGSGAREHALALKLAQSSLVEQVYCAPGNPGCAEVGTNLPVGVDDLEGLAEAAAQHQIDLTVVGPEAPLDAGIADLFQERGLTICGPTRKAARIEGSKIWAKHLMAAAGVPTSKAQSFTEFDEATKAALDMPLPVVIKADGLAAGKGVVVAHTHAEAVDALRDMMINRTLGDAANEVLLEDFLAGLEVSVLAITDGVTVYPLLPSCDYKRALDDDLGPNTGGMGAYAPVPSVDPELMVEIVRTVFQPILAEMRRQGIIYRGVLYAGMILTPDGPRVLEFNCRFGDPETQVLIPLLRSDLAELLLASANGSLASTDPPEWHSGACVGIVLASAGYPDRYDTGLAIEIADNLPNDALVFHAGTRLSDQSELVTGGGRVLTVVARGDSFLEARQFAYEAVESIDTSGLEYRRDIALREARIESGIQNPRLNGQQSRFGASEKKPRSERSKDEPAAARSTAGDESENDDPAR